MTTSSVSPVTTELAGSETGITLIIHAGAGSRGKHSTPERIAQVELDRSAPRCRIPVVGIRSAGA